MAWSITDVYNKVTSTYNTISGVSSKVNTALNKLTSITNTTSSIYNTVAGLPSTIYSQGNSLYNTMQSAKNEMINGVNAVGTTISNGINDVKTSIADIPNIMTTALEGGFSMFKDIGSWFVDGFKEKVIDPGLGGVKEFFNAVKKVPEKIYGYLHAEPPFASKIDPNEAFKHWTAMLIGVDTTVLALSFGSTALDASHPVKDWGATRLLQQTLGMAGAGYLNYAYTSTLLSITMQEPLKQHWNHKYTPNRPDFGSIMTGRARIKVSREDFEEELKYAGIDPKMKFDSPLDFYSTESIEKAPFEPEKWEPVPVASYGDLYQELSNTPISYFILNAVASSGLYNEELFMRALRDSDYGPLASALILQGLKNAFIDRKRTKYEDSFDTMYVAGELSDEEFLELYYDLYGLTEAQKKGENVATINLAFWKERKALNKKHVSVALLRKRFKDGGITEAIFRTKLLELKYSMGDIALIIDQAIADITEPVYLTKTDILRAYKAKIIENVEATARLQYLHLPDDDIEILLKLNAPTEGAA